MRQLEWKPELNSTLYVFDVNKQNGEELKTGPLMTYKTRAIFAYHHINAYEEREGNDGKGKRLVMDITGYVEL